MRVLVCRRVVCYTLSIDAKLTCMLVTPYVSETRLHARGGVAGALRVARASAPPIRDSNAIAVKG